MMSTIAMSGKIIFSIKSSTISITLQFHHFDVDSSTAKHEMRGKTTLISIYTRLRRRKHIFLCTPPSPLTYFHVHSAVTAANILSCAFCRRHPLTYLHVHSTVAAAAAADDDANILSCPLRRRRRRFMYTPSPPLLTYFHVHSAAR